MNNDYKLVKNTEWKEVEINGQVREVPLHWNISTIENKIAEYPPSKNHASVGNLLGIYPFFNASQKQTMFCNDFSIDGEAIIITTGGDYAFSQYFNGKFSFSSHVWCFKLKEDNNKYFSYLFKYFFNEIQNLSVVGFKLKNLNKKDFKRIEFHFADIQEQSAIANILSSQESIIQDIESLISKYESRFQYLSEELLSGKLRVKEVDGQLILYKNAEDNWKEVEINGEIKQIPMDWEVKTPIQLDFNIKTGKKDANAATINGLYPFFTCSANEILKINTYIFDTEALLISGNGSTLGEVKYYKGKFDAYQRTYVLDNIKNIQFMFTYFRNKFKDSLNIVGGSIPFIKIGDIENFDILLPTEKEQFLIASILLKQNEIIKEQNNCLIKEKQKFDWLLDNLLSGKYLIKEN